MIEVRLLDAEGIAMSHQALSILQISDRPRGHARNGSPSPFWRWLLAPIDEPLTEEAGACAQKESAGGCHRTADVSPESSPFFETQTHATGNFSTGGREVDGEE